MKKIEDLTHRLIKLFMASFFSCLLPLQIAALDPKQPIDHYLLDEWAENSDLPNLSIYNIIQSSDHFLWIEIDDDVVRFDGHRFTPSHELKMPLSRYRPEVIYNILMEDREGTLWLEGDEGLIKYRDNQFKEFFPLKSFPWEDFSLAVEDSWGNFWLGTAGENLYQLKNKKLIRFGPEKGMSGNGISSIMEDKHGNLWVAAYEDGIFKLRDGKFYPENIPGLKEKDTVNWLIEDFSGSIWIATSKGLVQKKGDEITWFTTKNGLTSNQITDIYQDHDGILWIGTDKGINRHGKDAAGKIVFDHLLEKEIINVIFEDNERNLWIGTEGSGLKRMRDRFFRTFPIIKDRQGYISAVHRSRYGETWTGTLYGHLIRIENKANVEQFKFDDQITAISDDGDGNLWVGTIKEGLFCLTPNRRIITYDEPFLKKIITLYCDSKNKIWIGTRNGLSTYHQDNFKSFQDIEKLPHFAIEFISEDDEQNILVGCYKGLYSLEKGNINPESVRPLLEDCSVTFVFKDREDIPWIGTGGCGLMRYKNHEFLFLEDTADNPVFAIYRILEDKAGYLWWSSNIGICRAKRKQLNDLVDKKIHDLNLNIFGVSDGLKSSECTGTSYNSAVEHENGEFWFATKKGIAVFQPEKVEINKQAPKVFIEKITVNREFISIDPEKNSFKSIDSIRFHFTAPTFISQDRVFFKIKLEGYDKDWFLVYPHERRTIEYRNLLAGDYKFRVTACNNDGVWNKEGVNFLFVVSPGFFNTTIFKIVIAAGIPLLLFLGYFLYVKYKQKEKKKQQPLTLDAISSDKNLLRLIRLLEEQNIYRDDSVSLNSLAEQLEISARQLSKLINEKLDRNFYDLINYYRIEEAKRLLVDEKNHRSIIEIAFYVGFNSKSSFNQAFKKQTDMTPSQFRSRFLTQ
jgi:ligand-binding sensor domain-containing protein/AraC-like DNA-binding protein